VKMQRFVTLRHRLGAAAALVLAPPLTIGVSLAALAGMIFCRMGAAEVQRFPAWWGRVICRLCGVRVEIHGREHLPVGRPCIIAANHASQFDIFALQGYLGYDFRWLAKKELFRIPIFGTAMRRAGYIPVDRGRSREAVKSVTAAARRIADGAAVIVFPEGTRSPDGRLRSFKGGAMVLAIKARVPIVPVGIGGSHEVLPKGRLLARPGRIVIRIGEPIDCTPFSVKDRDRLAAVVHRRIAALLPPGQRGADADRSRHPRETDR